MEKLLMWLTVLLLLLGSACAAENKLQGYSTSGPDFTTQRLARNGTARISLKAYKAAGNDQVMKQLAAAGSWNKSASSATALEAAKKLRWASIGEIRIIKTKQGDNLSAFHFTDAGFYTSVQLLGEADTAALAEKASQKYQLPISTSQFLPLPPKSFDCQLRLPSNGKQVIVTGKARSMTESPLRVEFPALHHSKERDLLLQQLQIRAKLRLTCRICTQNANITVQPGFDTLPGCEQNPEVTVSSVQHHVTQLSRLICFAKSLQRRDKLRLEPAMQKLLGVCRQLNLRNEMQQRFGDLEQQLRQVSASLALLRSRSNDGGSCAAGGFLKDKLALMTVLNLVKGGLHNRVDSRRLRAVASPNLKAVAFADNGARFSTAGHLLVPDTQGDLNGILSGSWSQYAQLSLSNRSSMAERQVAQITDAGSGLQHLLSVASMNGTQRLVSSLTNISSGKLVSTLTAEVRLRDGFDSWLLVGVVQSHSSIELYVNSHRVARRERPEVAPEVAREKPEASQIVIGRGLLGTIRCYWLAAAAVSDTQHVSAVAKAYC